MMMPIAEEIRIFVILHGRLLIGGTRRVVFLTFDWQDVLPTNGFHRGMSESLHEMTRQPGNTYIGKCSQSYVYKSNCRLNLQKLRNLSILDVWNGPGLRIRKWIDFITILCLEMTLFIQLLKFTLWWYHLLKKCIHSWFYIADCCLEDQKV